MIIFQIIQKPQLRGAEMFAAQLSSNLEKQGHQVFLISIFQGEADLPFEGRKVRLNRPLGRRLFDLKGWMKLAKLIREHRPDIIQANAADTLKFTVFSKLFFGWETPVIYRNANKMGDFIKSKFQYIFNRFLVKRTDFVISVSHECELDFKKTFNFPVEKINTVQIGVDKQEVDKVPADLVLVLASGSPVLVNVASFVPEKNHEGLIHIFNALVKKHPETQLLLIGIGKLQEEIKLMTQGLGLSKKVHFLGRRNDVLSIVKASDLFVMPSLIEGLPAVILEAMYCKTPVVAYGVGGIGEVVRSGETGWLIQKDEEAAFLSAIDEAWSNPEATNKITTQAYNMVTSQFMNNSIAERFETIYSKICS